MKRPSRITEYNRQGRGRELDVKESCPLLKGFAENCPYLFSKDVDMPTQIALFCLNAKHKDCPGFVSFENSKKR